MAAVLKVLRHRTERNEVYTIVMPGRVYRVIGDLYQTYSFEGNHVNAFEQAEFALTFLGSAPQWLRDVQCDG